MFTRQLHGQETGDRHPTVYEAFSKDERDQPRSSCPCHRPIHRHRPIPRHPTTHKTTRTIRSGGCGRWWPNLVPGLWLWRPGCNSYGPNDGHDDHFDSGWANGFRGVAMQNNKTLLPQPPRTLVVGDDAPGVVEWSWWSSCGCWDDRSDPGPRRRPRPKWRWMDGCPHEDCHLLWNYPTVAFWPSSNNNNKHNNHKCNPTRGPLPPLPRSNGTKLNHPQKPPRLGNDCRPHHRPQIPPHPRVAATARLPCRRPRLEACGSRGRGPVLPCGTVS